MSHKIAKARRAAERSKATPHDMHTLLVDMARQQRRADAHRLREHEQLKLKLKLRKAKDVLLGRVQHDVILRPTSRWITIDEYTDIFSKV